VLVPKTPLQGPMMALHGLTIQLRGPRTLVREPQKMPEMVVQRTPRLEDQMTLGLVPKTPLRGQKMPGMEDQMTPVLVLRRLLAARKTLVLARKTLVLARKKLLQERRKLALMEPRMGLEPPRKLEQKKLRAEK